MQLPGCGVNWLSLVHVVLSGLASLLTIWLAHRRKRADKERRKFYWQMRQKHGLHSDESEREAARQGRFL